MNTKNGVRTAVHTADAPNEAVSQFIEDLRDEASEVRLSAILVLAEMGNPSAVPALMSTLADADVEIRTSAAEALQTIVGHVGDDTAIPYVIEALYDEDTVVRANAAGALRQMRTPEALAALEAHEQQKVGNRHTSK